MLGDAVHNCCRRQLRRGSLTAHTRTHACTCMNCMQNLQIVCTEELVPQRRHSSAAGRGKTLLGSSASPGRARGVGCVGLGAWHAERCGDCGVRPCREPLSAARRSFRGSGSGSPSPAALPLSPRCRQLPQKTLVAYRREAEVTACHGFLASWFWLINVLRSSAPAARCPGPPGRVKECESHASGFAGTYLTALGLHAEYIQLVVLP